MISNLKIFIFFIILLVLNEIYQSYYRQYIRKKIYKDAKLKSKLLNKPLMVIGDPFNGIGSQKHGVAYGCGDICLDLTGCPKCKNGDKGKLENILPKYKSNSHIIFISCVLEYVDDIENVWKNLIRIAGDVSNIFLVTVSGFCFTAYFYKEKNYSAKRIIKDFNNNQINYMEI